MIYQGFNEDYRLTDVPAPDEKIEDWDLSDLPVEELKKQYQEVLQKLLNEPPALLHDAAESLKTVQEWGTAFAKKHNGAIRTRISKRHHTAIVTITVPYLFLTPEDYAEWDTIKEKVNKIILSPIGRDLYISLGVTFFSTGDSPVLCAWEAVFGSIKQADR